MQGSDSHFKGRGNTQLPHLDRETSSSNKHLGLVKMGGPAEI